MEGKPAPCSGNVRRFHGDRKRGYVHLPSAWGHPGYRDRPPSPGSKSKTTAGILAILLGGLGIHKFYLGYTGVGILHILLIFLCGISALIALIEGIIYLTKSDEEFDALYVRGNKSLF